MNIKLIALAVLSVVTLLSCGENSQEQTQEQTNSAPDLNKVYPSTINQQPETTTSLISGVFGKSLI